MKTHVDWVLSGDRHKASSRIQGFIVHEWLQRHGHASRIIATNFDQVRSIYSRAFIDAAIRACRSPAEVMIFEAPEWPMVMLAKLCSFWGKRTIAVRCDRMPAPYDELFDATILPTEGLRQELGVKNGFVIEDALEIPADACKQDYAAPGRLRIGWVGHSNYEKFIVPFVERLKSRLGDGFEFELISRGAFATRQWSEQTVVADLLSCDAAIVPIPSGEWFLNKSSNRLAMLFALGLPAVVTPIASYTDIGQDGVNVLFAHDEDAFVDRLLELRSAQRRAELGTAARRGIGRRFSLDTIAPRWLQAMQAARRQPRASLKTAAFSAFIRLAALFSRPPALPHDAR